MGGVGGRRVEELKRRGGVEAVCEVGVRCCIEKRGKRDMKKEGGG